jgi:hypothetical protein
MLAEDATLERITLLTAHRGDVQRIGWRLVRRLVQRAPIDQLDVGHRRSRRPPGVLVVEPAAQRTEDLRPVAVERASCAFAPWPDLVDAGLTSGGSTLSAEHPGLRKESRYATAA